MVMPCGQFLFHIALSHAWTMFTAGTEKNRYRESDEVAKATRKGPLAQASDAT